MKFEIGYFDNGTLVADTENGDSITHALVRWLDRRSDVRISCVKYIRRSETERMRA